MVFDVPVFQDALFRSTVFSGIVFRSSVFSETGFVFSKVFCFGRFPCTIFGSQGGDCFFSSILFQKSVFLQKMGRFRNALPSKSSVALFRDSGREDWD